LGDADGLVAALAGHHDVGGELHPAGHRLDRGGRYSIRLERPGRYRIGTAAGAGPIITVG